MIMMLVCNLEKCWRIWRCWGRWCERCWFAIWRNIEEFGDVGGDDAKDVGLQSGERCNWCDWCSRCTHPPKVAILHKINSCNTCRDKNCSIHVVQIKEYWLNLYSSCGYNLGKRQSCKNVPTVLTSRCYFFWPVLIFGKSTRKTVLLCPWLISLMPLHTELIAL